VQLSTYHKAKGLEWPVVILASLDRGEKRSVFDVAPETDRQAFDPSRPLDGRWIRCWPWPFGSQRQVPLATAADTSPEGLAVSRREDHELVRLLYVGFTRARDHLVLAANLKNGTPKVQWLDHLRDAHDDEPLLELPTAPESKKRQRLVIRGSDDGPVARIWHLAPAAPDTDRLTRSALHAELARPAEAADVHTTAAYRIAPSRAATEWPGLGAARVVATTRLAGRTPLVKPAEVGWDSIGTAVHAFLAADVRERPADARVAMARRLLEAAELAAALRPEALVAASDALAAFVATRFPGARWRREGPLAAVLDLPGGPRRVEGVLDLLLETPEGVVVIDHKSYPGAPSTWEKKALEHAPQLAAYAHALRMVEAVTVRACFVHFTLGGGMVELQA
ncbi:MAG: PD-(D/E)XK nuclease family protein, partial [Polyangiaceae bacterium]|nr:PD-(D/E)XK nuclease family protein [Polyangiaceae bacterium]